MKAILQYVNGQKNMGKDHHISNGIWNMLHLCLLVDLSVHKYANQLMWLDLVRF